MPNGIPLRGPLQGFHRGCLNGAKKHKKTKNNIQEDPRNAERFSDLQKSITNISKEVDTHAGSNHDKNEV